MVVLMAVFGEVEAVCWLGIVVDEGVGGDGGGVVVDILMYGWVLREAFGWLDGFGRGVCGDVDIPSSREVRIVTAPCFVQYSYPVVM